MRHARSFDKRTHEQLVEIGRKGGIASGRSRRERRAAINKARMEDQAHREAVRMEVELLRTAARELRRAARMQEGKGML